MSQKVLTEKQIINLLDKLNDGWNTDYWLFAGATGFYLMRKNEDGSTTFKLEGNRISPETIAKVWHGMEAGGGNL
jgi:hypothetical protein